MNELGLKKVLKLQKNYGKRGIRTLGKNNLLGCSRSVP